MNKLSNAVLTASLLIVGSITASQNDANKIQVKLINGNLSIKMEKEYQALQGSFGDKIIRTIFDFDDKWLTIKPDANIDKIINEKIQGITGYFEKRKYNDLKTFLQMVVSSNELNRVINGLKFPLTIDLSNSKDEDEARFIKYYKFLDLVKNEIDRLFNLKIPLKEFPKQHFAIRALKELGYFSLHAALAAGLIAGTFIAMPDYFSTFGSGESDYWSGGTSILLTEQIAGATALGVSIGVAKAWWKTVGTNLPLSYRLRKLRNQMIKYGATGSIIGSGIFFSSEKEKEYFKGKDSSWA